MIFKHDGASPVQTLASTDSEATVGLGGPRTRGKDGERRPGDLGNVQDRDRPEHGDTGDLPRGQWRRRIADVRFADEDALRDAFLHGAAVGAAAAKRSC
jgi:hypothetical protein